MKGNIMDWFTVALVVLSVLALVVASVVWVVLQFSECRSLGLSLFYCIQHVL